VKTRTKPRCSGCGRRIPRSEPDLILRRYSPDARRVELRRAYHERCKDAALEHVQGAKPALWRLTHRHIEAEAN
jgi:hypothetical protein